MNGLTSAPTRWPSALVALALTAGCVAGCGGGASASHGKLPRQARVVFASDRPADVGHLASASVSGSLIASLPFQPGRDGFSFENYGFIAGSGELDQHVLRELFGNGVCATAPSDSCTLVPGIQQFERQVVGSSLGGHCYGFSVTALRFFTHRLDPSQFGGTTPYSLSLGSSLASEIAYGYAMQFLSSVNAGVLTGSPSTIVADLEREFANPSPEVYTLGIRNGTGPQSEGHAVTPFGIDSLGGGRYEILIYDNNKPNTTQAVSVDVNSETWSYNVSTNPNNPSTLWSGQGANNPMQLAPLFPGLALQPCPFCTSAGGRSGSISVSLGGNPDSHGHLLIVSRGRKLGIVGGRFVNQIKGARVILPLLNEDWQAHPEPIYEVPAGIPLSVTLQGGAGSTSAPASVHVVGPGFGATVGNLAPGPGSSVQIGLGAAGGSISLRPLGVMQAAPAIELARNSGRGGKTVTLTPTSLAVGQVVSAAIGSSGATVRSSAKQTASVAVTSVGPGGASTKSQANVALAPSHAHTVPSPSVP